MRRQRGQDLRKYTRVLLRWLWLVVGCMVVAGGVAYGVSKLQPPIYRASTLLIVDQRTSSSDPYSNLLASDQLVSTYLSLIKQPPVMDAAAQAVGGVSPSQLASQTLVSNPGVSTQIIEIQVDDPSPARAAALANAIGSAFIQVQQQTATAEFAAAEQQLTQQLDSETAQIASLTAQIAALPATSPELPGLRAQLQTAQTQHDTTEQALSQLQAQALVDSSDVRVFASATPPGVPDHPKPALNAAIAAVGGLVVAASLVLLFELLDDRIRTPEEAQEVTGLPLLGTVPTLSARKLLLHTGGPSPRLQESLRAIRTNLNFASLGQPVRVVLVTSAVPNEGKTTLAINLAVALAETGKRVLLVDADFRRPSLHTRLGLANSSGLSLCLLEGRPMGLVAVAGVPTLRVLPAGPQPPNPSEMVGSPQMRALLAKLTGADGSGQESAEIVVLDTPPAAVFPDAAALAAMADATVLVLDRTKAREGPVTRMHAALEQVQARIAGVVINRINRVRDDTYYYEAYDATGKIQAVKAPVSAPLRISEIETEVHRGSVVPQRPAHRGPLSDSLPSGH